MQGTLEPLESEGRPCAQGQIKRQGLLGRRRQYIRATSMHLESKGTLTTYLGITFASIVDIIHYILLPYVLPGLLLLLSFQHSFRLWQQNNGDFYWTQDSKP